MPAPRTCRACGAPLLPDVRWCGRCHEPVCEFSARAPLHDGDFVAMPRHTGGAAPHWSRWGKDATTFGPRGRVGITATLVLFLVIGAFTQFLLLWLVEVIVGAWILKDVWRPAWVVPGEDAQARRPLPPDGRVADWLFDRDELVLTAAGVIVALGIGLAIMTGPPVVRFVTIFGVVILSGYLFFRNGITR
jgi:hypothetical protein